MTEGHQGNDVLAAIWADRLPATKDARAQATCVAIGAATGREVEIALRHLSDYGLSAQSVGNPADPSQRRAAAISVNSAGDGLEAARLLADLGYRSWDPLLGPAKVIHRRFRSNVTLARTTDATMVLDVRWPGPSGPAGRLPNALVPNENDYDLLALPTILWPLYLVIRPLRLIAERAGLIKRSTHQLGPFLGTPQALIGPLLALAGASADDVVADLGCGDGRVVLEAASTVGCKAIGVESNPDLAAQARQRLIEAGEVGNLVTILEGDATDVDRFVQQATIFFVFVPAEAAVELITRLLQRAKPGSRIVAHEQHQFVNEPPGAATTPVVVDDAVTVGHCWTVA